MFFSPSLPGNQLAFIPSWYGWSIFADLKSGWVTVRKLILMYNWCFAPLTCTLELYVGKISSITF